VLAALIVRRRSKASRTGRFERDAFDEAVEAQIEVKTRLLAIRDDIEPGGDLILDGHLRRIVLHFGDIRAAELHRDAARRIPASPETDNCR
jgi:hypothetical protein